MAEDVTVSIEHRAEGYLVKIAIPEEDLDLLLRDRRLEQRGLPRSVPLTGYKRDGDDSPKIVRVEIEILPLGWQESDDGEDDDGDA